MAAQRCMTLEEALDELGSFRAGRTKDGKLYLDGSTDTTEKAIKAAAHEAWVKRNLETE